MNARSLYEQAKDYIATLRTNPNARWDLIGFLKGATIALKNGRESDWHHDLTAPPENAPLMDKVTHEIMLGLLWLMRYESELEAHDTFQKSIYFKNVIYGYLEDRRPLSIKLRCEERARVTIQRHWSNEVPVNSETYLSHFLPSWSYRWQELVAKTLPQLPRPKKQDSTFNDYLHFCIKHGLRGNALILIEKIDHIDSEICDGMSATALAAEYGQITILSDLLKRNPNIEKGSPLCRAAFNGNIRMVKMLIAASANVDKLVWTTGKDNERKLVSPTSIALGKRHYEVAMYLVEAGANVNLLSDTDENLMHQAIRQRGTGAVLMVLLLLKHGADMAANDKCLLAENNLFINYCLMILSCKNRKETDVPAALSQDIFRQCFGSHFKYNAYESQSTHKGEQIIEFYLASVRARLNLTGKREQEKPVELIISKSPVSFYYHGSHGNEAIACEEHLAELTF